MPKFILQFNFFILESYKSFAFIYNNLHFSFITCVKAAFKNPEVSDKIDLLFAHK